jgi:hypothetical protein
MMIGMATAIVPVVLAILAFISIVATIFVAFEGDFKGAGALTVLLVAVTFLLMYTAYNIGNVNQSLRNNGEVTTK